MWLNIQFRMLFQGFYLPPNSSYEKYATIESLIRAYSVTFCQAHLDLFRIGFKFNHTCIIFSDKHLIGKVKFFINYQLSVLYY